MKKPQINFYLPDFFYLYNLNTYFISMWKERPDIFYDGVNIAAIYGSFPGAYWNGGRCIQGNAERSNIENTIQGINNLGVPIRYTFTNIFIDEHIIHDPYCNMLMELADNGMNEVLVNHPILEEYLKEKYPNFKYISSTTKCLMDINSINAECEKYYLTVLDFRKNSDREFHKGLKHKDKIELLINAYCSPECKKRKEHYEYLSRCQQNGETPQPFCDILTHSFYDALKLDSVIKIEDLFDYFIPEGFRHFKIEGRTLHIMDALESYVYYMIKPEYKDRVRYRTVKDLWI